MNKITPDMLGTVAPAITVPEYDWSKQSRIDAFGTWQNTNYTQNTYGGVSTYNDMQTDSYTD